MNTRYIKLTALSASLLLPLALVLLLLIPALVLTQEGMAASKGGSTSSASSEGNDALPSELLSQVMTQTTVLSGTYEGTVAITVPIQLGVLDLAFDLTDEGGTLTGHVNRSHTLVYDDEPALSGVVDTTVMTPTFTLESALFDDVVSNRYVERQFTLVGEVLEGGEVLQGVYTEVMTGFTPQPLNMEGLFMVTRPPNTIETTNLLVLTTNSVRTGTGGQVVATARVLDEEGQPVSGMVVTFASQLGTMLPASGTTNANGMVISTFTAGDMPGQASIEATCCDGTSNSVFLQVESQAPTTIELAADDSTLSMGSQTVISATVRDQFDNPISGTVVTFQGTLGNIAPASGVTDENGQANATFTAAEVGEATITALAESVSESVTIEITDAPTPTPTPIPSDDPVILALSPPTVTTSVDQTFEITIEVQAEPLQVDGVSVYLNFDPAYQEVASITLGSALPIELEKTFDNDSGQINLSAGAFSNFPSGTFMLATITFTATAQTDGTPLAFNLTGVRESDAVFDGTSVLNRTIGNTIVIHNATLSCSIDLEGRPSKPDPLYVSLTSPPELGGTEGGRESSPTYQFSPIMDENGSFTVVGIEPGSYELRVKHSRTLQNMQSVSLVAGSNSFDCSPLREGDADNSNVVNILDFSILAGTFGKCEGTTGYDERADFDENNCVNILDFSLLAGNFGQAGASPWPWPTLRLPDAPSQATGAPVKVDQVEIVVEPAPEVKAGELFTVAVQLETGSQLVDGAQVVLSFDSAVLEVLEVTASSDLPGKRKALPLQLQKQFDNARGTISFAAGTLEEFPSGTIDLLQIEFRALAPTTSTSLTWQVGSPDGTNVTFGGASVLGEQTDGTITISNEPTSVTLNKLSATTSLAPWLLFLAFTMLAGVLIVRRRR